MSTWTLSYWVHGKYSPSDWKDIKTSPETSISQLKEAIAERESSACPPENLEVYKIPEAAPILDDDSDEEILGKISIAALRQPLLNILRLSHCFEAPIPQDRLHLIVDDPTLTLNYWIRTTPFNLSGKIKVCPQTTVLELQKAIVQNEDPELSCSPQDLVVYKVFENKPILNDGSVEEMLSNVSIAELGEQLRATQTLSCFRTPIPQDRLHLIVDDATLILHYWIRSTPFHRSGEIKISPRATVLKLQKAIVQNDGRELSCSPQDLVVYKVPEAEPILLGSAVKETLGNLSIAALGEPLQATQALSSYFEAPTPRNYLHLIIDDPIVNVSCWFRGADPYASFMISSPASIRIDQLKDAIRAKKQVANNLLKLYKISTADDLTEILGTNGAGQLLDGRDVLRTVRSDVPFSDVLSVVIEVYEDERTKRLPPSAYRAVASGDPIVSARIAFLNHSPKESPSTSAKPPSFRTRQAGRSFIPCGRPRNDDTHDDYEETIPTVLLHAVFGQFVDDCHGMAINAEDNCLALELGIAMSKLYRDEASRVVGVNEVLARYQIYLDITSVQETNYYGDMSVNGHRYVIVEFKNEIGSTSAEPYFEAIASYLESTRQLAPKYRASALPCLLLAIFGPYIVFAGAAWNLRPTIQILSTPIAFHFHSSDTQNQLTVARHMAAFRKAIKTLDDYYKTLSSTLLPTSTPPAIQIFPHPTTYCSLHDETIIRTFQYEREVVEKRLIFFASETDGDRICVKFTRTYSLEAHEFLASLGCAPVLRGYQKVPGGWLLIAFDVLSDYQTLAAHTGLLSSSVFDEMSEKLTMLHQAGFVHGDVRDVNIMVSKSDEGKFMFIDFDWSGKIGEARYPACVNTTTIKRPCDVSDGVVITADHDLFMLDRIRRFKSKD